VDNIQMDLREIGWDGVVLNWSGSEEGPVEGSCEHGNEPSGSRNCWDVYEWLHNWQLLKKGSTSWVSEHRLFAFTAFLIVFALNSVRKNKCLHFVRNLHCRPYFTKFIEENIESLKCQGVSCTFIFNYIIKH
jgi:hypothetical protein